MFEAIYCHLCLGVKRDDGYRVKGESSVRELGRDAGRDAREVNGKSTHALNFLLLRLCLTELLTLPLID